MRKLLLTLLLASAATSPAFAEPQNRDRDREGRQEARQERQQQREERQQAREVRAEQPRVERPEPRNFERPQVEARERRFNGGVNVDATARVNREDVERIRVAREEGRRQRADGTSRWTRDNNQQPGETGRWVRDPQQRAGETNRWTRDRTGWTGSGDLRQRQQWEQRQQWQQRQQTTQNRRSAGTWNRDWRNDRRYDWRRYRDQHRSTFRIGIYYDPFGYNYQRFNIGYRLSPAYFGQRYWFDAAMYGLPYPPPGTQWVRYWNDALLVDMYSGQVIDAIPDFFW